MAKGKNGSQKGGPTACLGKNCEWEAGITGPPFTCIDGSGGCSHAYFCEAEDSVFHDATLAEATKKLNRILSRIPADSKGRKLSFCDTYMGTLLAWVDHGGKSGKGRRVTRNDDDATVAKALGLKVATPAAGKKR